MPYTGAWSLTQVRSRLALSETKMRVYFSEGLVDIYIYIYKYKYTI